MSPTPWHGPHGLGRGCASAVGPPFAPFRHRAFFWLWLGVVISQRRVVGADRRCAVAVRERPERGHHRPAGADREHAADDAAGAAGRRAGRRLRPALDDVRRSRSTSSSVAVLLAVLTAAGLMPPALLLAFTFAVGAGQAMLSPTWQSLITELVPRERVRRRDPARHGQRQRRPGRRPGDGRLRHRALGCPTGLRADRRHRRLSWRSSCSPGGAPRPRTASGSGSCRRWWPAAATSGTSRWSGRSCCASPPSSCPPARCGRCCR